ncbi:MAG: NAD(P)-dependent alcohol dehydrogenase [Chloroflexi bacterium]|nr:NAD(P)-dependent alcohol dehydrogenase [Chloroflexota bacterium]
MKAIVQRAYGEPEEVLSLQDVPMPAIKPDEVLVRVKATSLHPDVWHVVTGLPYVLRLMGAGVRRPKHRIPGTDLAGVVESVGTSVAGFKPGDEVFGESIKGYQWTNGGSFAEYAAVRGENLALKPANVTFEQAASVPTSGYIALSGLRDQGKLKAGQKILINGAGGGVGFLAVQIAKAFGTEVTAVDNTSKMDLLRSAGADHTIDYMQEDFTQGTERYDLILDIPGNRSFSEIKSALTPNGLYVLISHDGYGRTRGKWFGSLPRVFGLMVRTPFDRYLAMSGFSSPGKKETMAVLRDLIEARKVTPVVGKTFPLAEAAQAIRYLADGQAVGKVVLTV